MCKPKAPSKPKDPVEDPDQKAAREAQAAAAAEQLTKEKDLATQDEVQRKSGRGGLRALLGKSGTGGFGGQGLLK